MESRIAEIEVKLSFSEEMLEERNRSNSCSRNCGPCASRCATRCPPSRAIRSTKRHRITSPGTAGSSRTQGCEGLSLARNKAKQSKKGVTTTLDSSAPSPASFLSE
jgi:L-lactate utilization protein LutB